MTTDSERQVATPAEIQEIIDLFVRERGHMPSVADVILMHEAMASTALDKGDDGTWPVEGAYTAVSPNETHVITTEHGSFTAQGPSPERAETYTKADMKRAWLEGRAADDSDACPY